MDHRSTNVLFNIIKVEKVDLVSAHNNSQPNPKGIFYIPSHCHVLAQREVIGLLQSIVSAMTR